ncbi:MAG: 3-dehydroquinate synthase [Rubrobacteraceae bacterium]
MVERIEVPVSTPYPVVVGSGFSLAETVSETLRPGACAVITDSNVAELYARRITRELESGGWRVADVVEVPAGEGSKSLETYGKTVRRLAQSSLPRNGAVFALGGGVVGDLGGFVAGTYMRGVDFVALPTSLLAMVDSSVGGKVGVDLPEGKNLVGNFVRPRLVVADLGLLETLPENELSYGLAEVVKMGLLSGGAFCEDLGLIRAAKTGDEDALRTLVRHSIRFKAEVVADDERESGRRAILNYGHTIGHGLEAAAGYDLAHGEAISCGMIAAARLSANEFGEDLTGFHEELLTSANLPTKLSGIKSDQVVAAMGRDKKRRGGEHRFVLLEALGSPVWDVPVGEAEARAAIEGILE